MANPKNIYTKNPDEPILNHRQDRFGRLPFAKALAEAVVKVPNNQPFTVGLYGSWGSGKTSIINLVVEHILKRYAENTVVVRFNPWLFSDTEKLHMAFFATLASSLGKALPTRAQAFGKELEKYSQLTGSVSNAAKVLFPHMALPLVALSKISKPLYDLVVKILKKGSEDADGTRKRVDKLLVQSGKRVVIIVDDIDRLDSDEIHQIFKLVKNTAHFSNVSYLLVFDPAVVSQALELRYPGNPKMSTSFVDKIVQLPIDMPYVQQELLNTYLLEEMNKILQKNKLNVSQDDMSRFQTIFLATGVSRLFTTPRKVIRYLNMVDFSTERLRDEVNFTDIVLVDMIRAFFPSLKDRITENREIMLGKSPYAERDRDDVDTVKQLLFGNVKPTDLEVALIKELFPSVEWALGGASYGEGFDEQWENEQRICSEKYFDRYFAYDIPLGDIADNKIKSFLSFLTLPSTTHIQGEKRFEAMLVGNDPALLISKLRSKEDSLSESTSMKLASVVLAVGGKFAKDVRGLGGNMMSPNVQSAILGVKLTKKIKDPGLFLESYIKSVPINYAAEILKWIEVNSEDESQQQLEDALLNSNQIQKIGKILATRIKNYAHTHYLQTEFPADAQLLMYYWKKWGTTNDIEQYLESNFKVDPKRASEYLMTTIGRAYDLMTGRGVRSDFRREAYDNIAAFIDPEILVQPLISVFGNEVNKGSYNAMRDGNDDKSYEYQIARQFLAIHRSVGKAKQEVLVGEVLDKKL